MKMTAEPQQVEAEDLEQQGENEFKESESVEQLLAHFAGVVSMCWESPDKAGEFKSDHVAYHLDEALERLQELVRDSVAEYLANSAEEIAAYLPIFGTPGERAEIVSGDEADAAQEASSE